MRKWLSLGLLLIAACDSSLDPNVFAQDVVVRWGTSFGECIGFCFEELEIDQAEMRLTRRGWRPGEQLLTVEELPISESDRRAVLLLVESARMQRLEDVYGCPDCADGGSEWVELESGDSRKRVTFEFAQSPDSLEPLVVELRALRERFPEP